MNPRSPPTDMSTAPTITSLIADATDLAACERVGRRIADEVPGQIMVGFAMLSPRRASFLDQEARAEEAALERLLADVYWAAEADPREFHGLDGPVSLDRWRGASDGMFVHLARLANEASTPAAVRALMGQSLWDLRPLWKHVPGLPRGIDVLERAVAAHVEAAAGYASARLDAATRGMFAAKHWRTASRLSRDVGKIEWMGSSLAALRAAALGVADAPHWSLALLEIEVEVAGEGKRRRPDLVLDTRLEELRGSSTRSPPRSKRWATWSTLSR